MIKHYLKQLSEYLLPVRYQLPARYYWHVFNGTLDAEMRLVSSKLSQCRCFVDVGANAGLYSYHFSKKFSQVVAFEPLIERSEWIVRLNKHNITVHPVALSNQITDLKIWIPIQNGMLSTELASLEREDPSMIERVIPARTLDSYDLDNVDLLKIDVEGHELSVLEGGIHTIHRCNPLILVEIEQRHHQQPISRILNWFVNHGYSGYFLQNQKWVSIDYFNVDQHQVPYLNNVTHSLYVNNFLFMPITTPP